jgi:hypothetical protein
MTIRLIKHEAIPKCGSYEVRFPDGKPSRYFYWDDEASRRLRPEIMTSEEALEQAKAFARTATDNISGPCPESR